MKAIVVDAVMEKASSLPVELFALNVLSNHVHLVMRCRKCDKSSIIQRLKGYSSYLIGKYRKEEHNASRRIPKQYEEESSHHQGKDCCSKNKHKNGNSRGSRSPVTWARRYHCSIIDNDRYFRNAIEYVRNNHIKHNESKCPKLDEWFSHTIG